MPGTAPAASAPNPATAVTPQQAIDNPLRCGDFFTKAEVRALGLDAEHYKEDERQTDSLGVICSMGAAGAQIHRGERYAAVLAAVEASIKDGTIKPQSGPTLGSDARWYLFGGVNSVVFLASSKAFSASVRGDTKALVEKVARALDAKMKKPQSGVP